jgi:hypothetical protein
MADKHQVAVYYFPNYHIDSRNEEWHGKGWTEWELVKYARPRFPGHQQPKVPAWGYEDESDPAVMAKKIDAAADHGIDVFIFDWYWHEAGPYLDAGLEKGFLNAPNNDRLKFSLMWANHDWVEIHPARRGEAFHTRRSGDLPPEGFWKAMDHIVREYFTHPSYWRVDGGLYLSFYDLANLVATFGSPAQASEALGKLRKMVADAGLGDLHLNAVIWSEILLPGEKTVEQNVDVVGEMGFDSVTNYVWLHHQAMSSFPFTPYGEYRDLAVQDWDRLARLYPVPYIPNVIMGWDSSPRTIQTDGYDLLGYPFLPILKDNDPGEFRKALEHARRYLDGTELGVLTINAWNEWTEGSYLEPDTVHGMAYLEAIRDVFGP